MAVAGFPATCVQAGSGGQGARYPPCGLVRGSIQWLGGTRPWIYPMAGWDSSRVLQPELDLGWCSRMWLVRRVTMSSCSGAGIGTGFLLWPPNGGQASYCMHAGYDQLRPNHFAALASAASESCGCSGRMAFLSCDRWPLMPIETEQMRRLLCVRAGRLFAFEPLDIAASGARPHAPYQLCVLVSCGLKKWAE
jgi:hypothetical protein